LKECDLSPSGNDRPAPYRRCRRSDWDAKTRFWYLLKSGRSRVEYLTGMKDS